MKRRLAVLLILGLMPWAGLHAQQTASTTFRVSATVQAVCEVTASDLNFGSYSAQSGSPLQGTTVLKVTCTPGTNYNVGLNQGTSPGATINQRRMVSGGVVPLNYQLYSDPGYLVIWGNTPPIETVPGAGTGLAVDHTVYGRIPAGQNVPAAEYGDTITVTIFY